MTTDIAIAELLQGFEDGSLPGERWTHHAHLVMALWYLRRHPLPEATRRIRSGIQAYNASQGKTTGYHETITLAWIELISRFLDAQDGDRSDSELAQELLATLGTPGYLGRFYSDEVLRSTSARATWVPPDRLGFDESGDP